VHGKGNMAGRGTGGKDGRTERREDGKTEQSRRKDYGGRDGTATRRSALIHTRLSSRAKREILSTGSRNP
jgi:hypothetical protein